MIEVRNVYKSFNGKEVLKDISFTFEAGKTNLIIGQSGSGKTVLMKSVIGIHQVDRGQILYTVAAAMILKSWLLRYVN